MALYKSLVNKVSISPEKKIKQKNYLPAGELPIIDQGQNLIGGYTEKLELELQCNLPVIVFGDHTRAVKYVDFPFCAGADGIKVLEAEDGIYPKYLYYATLYLVLGLEDRGYARHYQYVEKKEIGVPSIKIQKRIVARIEELFSELDSGVETLKTVKAQLEVYRQAVLQKAFDGDLTNSKLLKFDTLGSYIEKPRYGTSKKCGYNRGKNSTAVYRIPNIDYEAGCIDHSDLKYATFTDTELKELRLESGDILIIRSNGSVSLVGRAAMVEKADINGTFAGYLMRLRIKDRSVLNPRFLLIYLQSRKARSHIESKAKSTSGVNNINAGEVCTLTIPLFNNNEQVKIVESIEARLSICDNIKKTVDTALQQAEAMRQSILKKAFEEGGV